MDRPKEISPLAAEVLGALFSKTPTFAENLPEDDPLRKHTNNLGALFTEGVMFLKAIFPNPRLNKLGALVWDIVGHRIVPLAVGPNVPSMCFAAYVEKTGAQQGVIFVPPFWKKMIIEDSMMQFGAIVYNGSKAVDFYNGRMESGRVVDDRAALWESEFLHTLRRENSKYAFNDYQKKILEAFPNGLDSPGYEHLLYESKPFFVPTA